MFPARGKRGSGLFGDVGILTLCISCTAVLALAVSVAMGISYRPPLPDPASPVSDVPTGASVKSTSTSPTETSTGTARIRILGVNDFHGNLTSPKEIDGRAVGGAPHLSAYLDALESEVRRQTLRVHAGDMVGASPLASAHYRDEPAIRAMNGMDFDIGVLGNHEFDEGMDEMMRLVEGGSRDTGDDFSGADFPYLAANVVERGSDESILPPYRTMEISGVEVGFIGVVTKETPQITAPEISDSLRFLDISETVNLYTDELTAQGVNTIVVLTHSGGTQEGDDVSGEIVYETSQMSKDVDAVFGGHTHARMETRVGNKILVEGGSYGEAVSVVDLDIDRATGEVVGSDSRLVTTYNDSLPPDRDMLDVTNRFVRGVEKMSERELGTAAAPVTREYSASGENALGNLIADARRDTSGADFAFVLSGAMRDDLSGGTITYGDVFAANPGENDLMTTQMSGDAVRRVLEAQFREGSDRRLQVSGLSYTYDPALPQGERVTSINLPDGSPVLPDETYTVAAEEYISRGGNGFDMFGEGGNQRTVGTELDATVTYIESLPEPFTPPNPETERRITRE